MGNQKTTMYVLNKGKTGVIYTPKIKFSGGEVKWYQDTYKTSAKKLNQ